MNVRFFASEKARQHRPRLQTLLSAALLLLRKRLDVVKELAACPGKIWTVRTAGGERFGFSVRGANEFVVFLCLESEDPWAVPCVQWEEVESVAHGGA